MGRGVGFGRAFQILIFLSFFFPFKIISHNNSSSNTLCIDIERDALLKFKKELQDPSNRLSSWISEVDCCKWVGIQCDGLTGHIKELNLSSTSFDPFQTTDELILFQNFKLGGKLSNSILNLKHISYIDLSYNDFQGLIPHQVGNLSNLQRLHLGGNYFYSENLHWIQNLHSLVSLDLSNANLRKASDWLLDINKLPFLVELHLSDCELHDHNMPLSDVNFTSLSILDLSSNIFNSIPKWISKLGNLVSLDLKGNFFQGPLPRSFSNFTSLQNLNLEFNNFNSSIPEWLFTLTTISSLDISYNYFEGPITCAIQNLSALTHLDLSNNDGFQSTIINTIPSCLYSLHKLHYLNLAKLHLQGEISNDIANLTHLVSLHVEGNELVGNIPRSITKLSSLEYLYLSRNKLSGTIPKTLGLLLNLKKLSISHNCLEGIISEVHFANHKSLEELAMSGNNLTFNFPIGWVPPFKLTAILLRSCNLGPKFPKWLESQTNLSWVDLSNAKISDTVSNWFWNLSTSFEYLNLSHNQLSGKIPNFFLDNGSFIFICLQSNNFHGNLPHASSHIFLIDFSDNFFSGNISRFFCHSINQNNSLRYLYLEHNLLSGNIPNCWKKWMSLKVVNLDNNNFSGKLPNSIGSLINLRSLHLRNNSLFGKIPHSLKECSMLSMLDLGLNSFEGNIPTWIGTSLTSLVALSLRSNQLIGLIPHELCHLSFLQIMDIGNNNFIGSIPYCFGNFTAMSTTNPWWKWKFNSITFIQNFEEDLLPENTYVITKGEEFQYNKILGLMKSMDLSNNNLSGEIPQEITNLFGLKSLNLSGNHLRGRIPQQIGSMTDMESLDLSRNQLSGPIPPSISNLTFLGRLNLSYNDLMGPIPTSTQLQSFDPSSFVGNELCGLPLGNSCSWEKTTENKEKEEAKEGDENYIDKWFYLSVGIGFVVGFWGIWGPLLVSTTWRHTYYRKFSSFCHFFI